MPALVGTRRAPLIQASGGGVWTEVYSATLSGQDTGYFTFTGVQVIPVGNLSATGGTQIRLTLSPRGSAGDDTKINSVYVSNGGGTDAFDHGETPVQILFGGASGTTLTANGSDVVSDGAAFVKDGTNTLIISFDLDGASANDIALGTVTSNTFYGKFGVSEAGTEDKSTYTDLSGTGNARVISKVELLL